MTEAAVELRGITKTFRTPDGTVTPLREVSLTVERNKITVLLGRSGCGKSTLLSIAAGLLAPDTGEVIRNPSDRLAVVFQDPRLLPWKTALENVMLALLDLPADEARAKAAEALARVGLQGKEQSYPSELSGGQAQRVGLARALAVSPDILFLDEPFGALDALTREELQTECARLLTEEGITVFMITHDVREAVRLGDCLLIQHGGKITERTDVDAPRPRDARDSGLFAVEERIRAELLALRD